MTQIEQISLEIEQRIEQFKEERSKVPPTTPKSVDRLSLGARIAALEETLVFIQSLPAEQPSKALEEAAEEYSGKASHPLNNAFKAGARWQKERTIKIVCEWLDKNADNYVWYGFHDLYNDIRKVMEEEK